MAEISLAASIVGLVSLGLQISQGLYLYIDSAKHAKPRVQAIVTDITLAIAVVDEFKRTLEDPTSKVVIKERAQFIAKSVISQFHRVFKQIEEEILVPDRSGFRVYRKLKWPFEEGKVKDLRTELDSAKATLQLLINVIIVTDSRMRRVDETTLERQQQRTREAKRTQKRAMAALGTLQHGDQIQGAHSNRSDIVVYVEYSAESDHSENSFGDDGPSSDQDNVYSGTSSEHENLRGSLISDYSICLRRLKSMQTVLEGALDTLDPETAERSTASARHRMITEVDKTGRKTLLVLEKHVVKSISHRRIMRKGNHGPRRRSAETMIVRGVHSHGATQSGTEDDEFMDAVGYQSDAVEHGTPPDDSKALTKEKTVVLDDIELRNKQAKMEADAASERRRIIDPHEIELSNKQAKLIADAEAAAALKLEIEQPQEVYAAERVLAEEKPSREVDDGFLRKQKETVGAKERENQAFLRIQKERYRAEEVAKEEEQIRINSVLQARFAKLGYSQYEIDRVLRSDAVSPDETEEVPNRRRFRRRSRSPGPSDKSSTPSRDPYQGSRERADAQVSGRTDQEKVAQNLQIELEREREEAKAGAAAQRIREAKARTHTSRPALGIRGYQPEDQAAARLRWDLEARRPKLKMSDDTRRQHASRRFTGSEAGRQHTGEHSKSKVSEDYDSSDSTVDGEIEELVREWTNLYDQTPTTFPGVTAEQTPRIEEGYETYRYTQPPRSAKTFSPPSLPYIENSWASGSSTSHGSRVIRYSIQEIQPRITETRRRHYHSEVQGYARERENSRYYLPSDNSDDSQSVTVVD